jgi:hypothetical protein
MQAQETLQVTPLHHKDGHVKMFLKDDKYQDTGEVGQYLGQDTSIETSYTAPRCIQYRNKRYGLRLATYLHPIEEHCYSRLDWTGTPIFAKSRNFRQRGSDLRSKWEKMHKPIALLLDHSKFDAHVGVDLLSMEHKFYRSCNNAPELKWLLQQQMVNKGYTKNDTRYTTQATRMSGDQNTGLGNSVVNYAMLAAFVDHFGLIASIYVDGDDSVLVIDDQGLKFDVSFFKQFGMATKHELTYDFSKVEFCQTRPVLLDHGWTMTRNPYRVLTRMPWTTLNLGPKKLPKHLASIGRCEMAMGMGAPIGQYIGYQLSLLSDRHINTDLEYVAKLQMYRPTRAHLVSPSEDARYSYEEAWGLSPDFQRYLESATINFDISLLPIEETPFLQ